MKHLILTFCCVVIPLAGFCQADTIYMHSGAAIGSEIKEVLPYTITYVPSGGKNPKVVSKRAVQRVIYANGNKLDDVSPFISVQGESDWEKVVLLSDESETGGLSYSGEIRAEGGGKFVDSAQANTKAVILLKKEAAGRKCPYVYVVDNKLKEVGYVGRVIKKSAVSYKY